MRPNPTRSRRDSGLSIVESLICLAILAVMLGSTLPGMKGMLERRHLEGSAAQLATDLRLVRSLAMSQATTVHLAVQSHGADACYVAHTGTAGSCRCDGRGHTTCAAGSLPLRSVGFAAEGRVRLSANVSNMLFDASRGTVTPGGTIRLHTADGSTINQVVSLMGRARACSPSGGVLGYPRC